MADNNKIRAHIWASGVVQGVFLRENAGRRAGELLIFGWIRNLPDGRVEAIFEGGKDSVEKIIEWLRQGPDSAVVEELEVKWGENRDEFSDFSVR
ncbi:MAG: acylphosphatase [Patescibacteria group bacterium]